MTQGWGPAGCSKGDNGGSKETGGLNKASFRPCNIRMRPARRRLGRICRLSGPQTLTLTQGEYPAGGGSVCVPASRQTTQAERHGCKTEQKTKQNTGKQEFMQKRKGRDSPSGKSLPKKNGGDLLSRLRSTIGVRGLNCSVRNGKRWNPAALGRLNDLKIG